MTTEKGKTDVFSITYENSSNPFFHSLRASSQVIAAAARMESGGRVAEMTNAVGSPSP